MDVRQLISGWGQPKSQTVDATAATGNTMPAPNQPLADLTQAPDTFERVNAPSSGNNGATVNQTGIDPANPNQPDPNQSNDNGEASTEMEHHVLKHFTDAANRDAGVDGYMNKIAQVFGEIPKS